MQEAIGVVRYTENSLANQDIKKVRSSCTTISGEEIMEEKYCLQTRSKNTVNHEQNPEVYGNDKFTESNNKSRERGIEGEYYQDQRKSWKGIIYRQEKEVLDTGFFFIILITVNELNSPFKLEYFSDFLEPNEIHMTYNQGHHLRSREKLDKLEKYHNISSTQRRDYYRDKIKRSNKCYKCGKT